MSNRCTSSSSPPDLEILSSGSNINSRSSTTSGSPKQGGRPRDLIWSHFDDMGPAKTPGHRQAQCKYCLLHLNFAKLNMMYSHIAHQCNEVISYDPNARKEVINKLRDLEQQPSPARHKKGAIEMILNDSACKQYTMDKFTSRIISYSEQQSIDRYLLRSLIMNGISFRTANNNFFVEFVKKLNPSYDLPGRKKLAQEVLIQEVLYVENKNESLIAEAAHLTLNIDGWTDQCHRSLYEYNVITDSRKAIVLSLIDISRYSHTADFLVNRLESVLVKASTNINILSKICAIVTDNPTTMECMRKMFIGKPANQHIIELRCFAHAINLIAGDVVKHAYAKNIISKVAVITSFANRSHAFKSKLKEEAARLKIKKETLDTIINTRWSSVADCLHSLIVLRAPLEVLVAVDDAIAPTKVSNIINNRSFFNDVENLYKLMKPLAYAMSIIQSSSITLADCFLILSYLRLTTDQFTTNTETRMFGRYVSKVTDIRLKEFQNDFYLSAYYLHPKFRGAGMLTDGRSAVYRCLAEYSKKIGNNSAITKNVISALQRYEIRSGPYSLHYTQDDTPASWWSMINDNTHKNSLSKIALRLFSITPHSVMPERLFSILDWQHTKRRNRLSPFSLESIAKIHTFYKTGLNNPDDPMDTGYIEDLLDLTNDSSSESVIIDGRNNSVVDAIDFFQSVNDNHRVLREKCEEENINEDLPIENENISKLDRVLNTDDRDFQHILVDLGLIDIINLLSPEDYGITEDELAETVSNDDYDVEELLTAALNT